MSENNIDKTDEANNAKTNEGTTDIQDEGTTDIQDEGTTDIQDDVAIDKPGEEKLQEKNVNKAEQDESIKAGIRGYYTHTLEKVQAQLDTSLNLFNRSKHNRKVWVFFCLVLALVLTLYYTKILWLSNWILIVVWIIFIFFILAIIGLDVEKWKAEVERLESTKTSYEGFLGIREEATYFDRLVQINMDNLAEYYSLVKVHTNQSFKTCVLVGIIGFLLIIMGVAIGYFNQALKDISYLSAGTGIITEFISGVFFYLYNKTVRQLKEYHDSLLEIQNVLISFKLVDGLESQDRKSEMIKAMIQFLVDRTKTSKNTNDIKK